MSVGIERLAVYVPQYALRLTDLAAARGVPAEKMTAGLGVHEMAIPAACDDVVTLAATAGGRLLRAADVDPDAIGMLLVATETGVDHSKPVSIFVHDLLGIGPRCRVYELKHACYAGTAALMTAADWVRASKTKARRALVIAADIARYALGSPGEPTQGAGAVALLVGPEPRALFLSEDSGVHAANVYDFWRPLDRREALVDGKFSIECYLDALSGAFKSYRDLERPALAAGEGLVDRLARVLYHVPFPKMASKAHRRLLELDRGAVTDDAFEASYAELVAPGLAGVSQIGNTYTASLYVCLASILENEGRTLAGRRIGLFSYGSGCCAEFFTGTVPAGAASLGPTGVRESLARRTLIDVPTYEQLLREGEQGGTPPQGFTGDFVFRGIRDDRRRYAHVREALAA
jgi:hydroxymethylglutaryl-CoA synthase